MWGSFKRPDNAQPIIRPDETTFDCPMTGQRVHWRRLHTFNPAAAVRGDKVVMLFRAEDDSGAMQIGGHTSRLGYAESEDGIHFTLSPEPVLFPNEDEQRRFEWPGGCEDPRVVEAPDGTYVLMYTQYDRKVARLAVATSPDLIHWTKHGPAFWNTANGRYRDTWTKAGAIICRREGERLVATKIGGQYWMLFGEYGMHCAVSDDLIHWTPITHANDKLLPVLAPRPGRFDSGLAEGGPPPVVTDEGILALYNGKNAEKDGDPSISPGAYCVGQARLDPADPTRVLERGDTPIFGPELPWESSGQYTAGTTFAQGLVLFRGRWFLYYGCADSFVGVAVAEDVVNNR